MWQISVDLRFRWIRIYLKWEVFVLLFGAYEKCWIYWITLWKYAHFDIIFSAKYQSFHGWVEMNCNKYWHERIAHHQVFKIWEPWFPHEKKSNLYFLEMALPLLMNNMLHTFFNSVSMCWCWQSPISIDVEIKLSSPVDVLILLVYCCQEGESESERKGKNWISMYITK